MLKLKKRQLINHGFTIVELLVVIVVIAILAAITIVSYTGVSQRAIVSAIQSDLTNNSNLLKMYYTDNGHYPTSPLDSNNCTDDSRYCLKASNGNTLNYTSDGTTFKLVTTNTSSSTSYYITEILSSTIGGENLLSDQNASFETGTGDWSVARVTKSVATGGKYGVNCLKLTGTAAGYQYVSYDTATIPLTIGDGVTSYTLSGYVKGEEGSTVGDTVRIGIFGTNTGWTWIDPGSNITLTSNWQRFSVSKTFSVLDTQRLIYPIYQTSGYPSIGDIWYIDAIQLEKGSPATPF